MKIRDLLETKFCISFEFFPPKTEEGEQDLFKQLKKLETMHPDFVSVTYGAGGSTRDRTNELVNKISVEENWNVMAHLTGVGHSKGEIEKILESYRANNIQNILALRGDAPAGTGINPSDGVIPHAVDLIRLIKEISGGFFSVGGAAFPERHVESPNWEWEMRYFKEKTEAGLDFAITQLFFDNRYYYKFIDQCYSLGIKIPIIPGIMPITNFKQIQKFAMMCNATIPHHLTGRMEKVMDNQDEVTKIGVEFAVEQCADLLKNKVPGLHFYTLNKSTATISIFQNIKDLL